jgi:hypothetical protein
LIGTIQWKDNHDADILDMDQPSTLFLSGCVKTHMTPHKLHFSKGCMCILLRNLSLRWSNGNCVVVHKVYDCSMYSVDADCRLHDLQEPGPYGLSNERFLLVLLDDYSRMSAVAPLAAKSDAAAEIKRLILRLER